MTQWMKDFSRYSLAIVGLAVENKILQSMNFIHSFSNFRPLALFRI